MLTIWGNRHRYCKGLSRRSFLRIGGLAMGGMALPQILRAEAETRRTSHKAIIMIAFLTQPAGESTAKAG
jgi:hypothetical protein